MINSKNVHGLLKDKKYCIPPFNTTPPCCQFVVENVENTTKPKKPPKSSSIKTCKPKGCMSGQVGGQKCPYINLTKAKKYILNIAGCPKCGNETPLLNFYKKPQNPQQFWIYQLKKSRTVF